MLATNGSMDISNHSLTNAPWLRRSAALIAVLALAACSAGIDDPSTDGTDEAVLDEQVEALAKDDAASAELSSKELDAGGSLDPVESTPSTLKSGGLNFDCTTECGGGGGCCTCYGIWDCILLGGSGQCKPGTFGCGGDGCMCDWKVFH